jgi:hypothetical protein
MAAKLDKIWKKIAPKGGIDLTPTTRAKSQHLWTTKSNLAKKISIGIWKASKLPSSKLHYEVLGADWKIWNFG